MFVKIKILNENEYVSLFVQSLFDKKNLDTQINDKIKDNILNKKDDNIKQNKEEYKNEREKQKTVENFNVYDKIKNDIENNIKIKNDIKQNQKEKLNNMNQGFIDKDIISDFSKNESQTENSTYNTEKKKKSNNIIKKNPQNNISRIKNSKLSNVSDIDDKNIQNYYKLNSEYYKEQIDYIKKCSLVESRIKNLKKQNEEINKQMILKKKKMNQINKIEIKKKI